jgi:glycosyltransferase involved in cell wall biosynthesis
MSNPIARKSDDKRLLLVLPWMTMGGADRYNVRLVEQLTKRGWQVTIACTLAGDYSWLPDFAKLTSDIHILPNVVRLCDQPAYLRHLIESREPSSVLLTGSELGYRLLPYLRTVCPKQAYLDYCHIEEENWKNGGHPRSSAGVQDLLECAMVTSEHLKKWEVSRGGDAQKIQVVYINEDPGSFDVSAEGRAAARKALGIPSNARVVMFAGRLTAQKQPHVLGGSLRRMFELLDAQRSDRQDTNSAPVIALIAGDGPDRGVVEKELASSLKQHVDAAGANITRASMLGGVPAEDMPKLYAASDVLFLPSQWEGISLAIYEAMAAGLAIVGADVGGQRELVTSDVGVLLPRGSPSEEIERYARELANMLQDEPRMRACGKAARERIEKHFALDAMGERVESILLHSVQRVKQDAARQRSLLPMRLAHELATQAIELQRVNSAAEHLWHENQKLHGAVSSRSGAPSHSTSSDPRQAALHELAYIENSRAWRTVQGLKRNPLYGAIATARWGSEWQMVEAKEPPEAKLARIKSSKAYRLIQGFKQTPVYRAYAKRKYGR